MSKSKIAALKKLQTSVIEQGHWDNVEDYRVGHWKQEIQDNNTRLGYKDWVLSMIEQDIAELEMV